MASRFSRKPDPAIKKNVRRARSAARNAKNLHASVVAVSLAATLSAWALFTGQDAQALEAARAAKAGNSNQTALTSTMPEQSPAATQPITTQTSLRLPVPPFITVIIR